MLGFTIIFTGKTLIPSERFHYYRMELVIHQTGMCSHDEMPVGHNTEI
jgi:hypothetical protein